MSDEIQIARQVSSLTLYAAVRDRAGAVWDDAAGAFVAIESVTWGDADLLLAEQGTTGDYFGDLPAAIADGQYTVEVFEQIGGAADRKADTLLAVEHVLVKGDRLLYGLHALGELVADDAGVVRYTANALELGPAGGVADIASSAQRVDDRFVWILGNRAEGILARNKIAVGPEHDTVLAMDFRHWLAPGEQLQSIEAVTDTGATGDLVITPGSIVYEEARARVSGGVAGTEYRLRYRANTSGANTLEGDGILTVS